MIDNCRKYLSVLHGFIKMVSCPRQVILIGDTWLLASCHHVMINVRYQDYHRVLITTATSRAILDTFHVLEYSRYKVSQKNKVFVSIVSKNILYNFIRH